MSNVLALKILVLLLAAPIWIPFAKELKKEVFLAMREQGGFTGPKLTPSKAKEVLQEIERSEEPPAQVHVLKAHLRLRKKGGPNKRAIQTGPQAGQRVQRRMGR